MAHPHPSWAMGSLSSHVFAVMTPKSSYSLSSRVRACVHQEQSKSIPEETYGYGVRLLPCALLIQTQSTHSCSHLVVDAFRNKVLNEVTVSRRTQRQKAKAMDNGYIVTGRPFGRIPWGMDASGANNVRRLRPSCRLPGSHLYQRPTSHQISRRRHFVPPAARSPRRCGQSYAILPLCFSATRCSLHSM